MGFFLRKSQKVGPFRINFSTSGIGISTGVTGARVSIGPRGTYVHLGRNGVYYRKKVDLGSGTGNNIQPHVPPVLTSYDEQHSITTLNFDELTDADSVEFIKELEEKDKKISFFNYFGIFPSIIILLFFFSWSNQIVETTEVRDDFFRISSNVVNLRSGPSTKEGIVEKAYIGQEFIVLDSSDHNGWIQILTHEADTSYVFSSLGQVESKVVERINKTRFENYAWAKNLLWILIVSGLIAWCVFLYKKDKKRKTVELYYAMEEELEEMYKQFLLYFSEFTKSRKIWQKLHSQHVSDTKYTAGASSLVRRLPVTKIEVDSKPTPFIKTNVEIPHIKLKNTDLYFFPERLVLKRNTKFASVFYKNLEINSYPIRFIEDGGVPGDANIIDYTWKYVNKKGGPDRRFSNNRQIPICEYSEYHFRSEAGINEVISTSKFGAMDPFASFINKIGRLQMQLV